MGSSWSNLNVKRWARGFAALAKFRARKGHCCPARYHTEGKFKLGQWVSVQRYHKDHLPVQRKQLLSAIGFVWDGLEQLWEHNFAALLKFKRREGHCCVPTYHTENGLKLGWWVATQRRTKKKMSKERRTRLNEVGFVWRVLAQRPPVNAPSAPNPLRLHASPLARSGF